MWKEKYGKIVVLWIILCKKSAGISNHFFIMPCTFRHISQRHGIFKHALGRIIWPIDDFMDAPADEIILKNTG